jgi:hypothetical protein
MNYQLQELKEFLLSKSHYEDGLLGTPCLIWNGARNSWGYGNIKWLNSYWRVHRLSLFIANGIEPKLHVLHKYDTGSGLMKTYLDGLIEARSLALERIEELKPETNGNYEIFELERHVTTLDSAITAARQSEEGREPWRRCPSTHCERRQECASPHECIVKASPTSNAKGMAGPHEEEARNEARKLAERAGIDMLDDHDQFINDLTETLLRFAALRARPDAGTFAEGIEAVCRIAEEHEREHERKRIEKARSYPDECSYHLWAEQTAGMIARAGRALAQPEKDKQR